MKKERVVPKKNYLYLLIMILCVVLVTFFIFGIGDKIKNRKLETSYLNGYISEVNINEIDSVLTEPNNELFIIITKTNDNKIYKIERDVKKIIKKKNLRDSFIYIDYTDGDIKKLNEVFNSDIKTIPAIIYFKNGEFVKSVDNINGGEVEKLLEEYEVE